MNMRTNPPRTAVETALLDSFVDRMGRLPGNAQTLNVRDGALEVLKQQGLPTRKQEAWHYTDLRALLHEVPDFETDAPADVQPAFCENSTVIATVNARSVEENPLPDGVSIEALGKRLEAGDTGLLTPAENDVVKSINTAFVSGGYVLNIESDTQCDQPIELQTVTGGGQSHTRTVVNFGADSSTICVERHISPEGISVFASHVTELTLDAGAQVTWLIVQRSSNAATHMGQLNATLAANAKLTLFVINVGGRLVRQEINTLAAERGAEFTLRGINLLADNAHCDVTMVLDHAAPDTKSTETIRNIVTDSARGVFQGQIRVAKQAQKTDAVMACNTLLLSDDAGFSTKPELEIFADDVACGHGATVTEIDQNHLFYLMARGIDEKTARGLLVKAFVNEVIEELEDEALVERLEQTVENWFVEHC